MKSLVIASQLIIALVLLNVWLLRAARPTAWRAGGAKNMREEFAVYGLPHWFMKLVGLLKIMFALLLIAGLFLPFITRPAAVGIVALMLGAIAMHLKVADPLRKSLPALSLLVLSLFVAVL